MYDKPIDRIEHNGKTYRLTLSFDRVLSAISALNNKGLFREDALDAAISLLVVGRVNPRDANGLLDAIFTEITPKQKGKRGQKAVDFIQDAKYIYASFMQAYHIDLHVTKPHWLDFLALFEGLPSETIIKRIMDIRTRKPPKATKHNQESIRELLEAKAAYRLNVSKEERAQGFESGLQSMAQALFAMARK